jgi:hypothetical protein
MSTDESRASNQRSSTRSRRGFSRRAGSSTRSRRGFSRRAKTRTQSRRGFSRRAKTRTRTRRVVLSPRPKALVEARYLRILAQLCGLITKKENIVSLIMWLILLCYIKYAKIRNSLRDHTKSFE